MEILSISFTILVLVTMVVGIINIAEFARDALTTNKETQDD